MSNPVTQTTFDGLIDKIYAAFAKDEGVSEFERRRWDRDVAALQKIDAVAAMVIKGAIASLDGDLDAVNEHCQNALHLAAYDPMVLRNFAVSYGNFGDCATALSLLKRALGLSPNAPDLFRLAGDAAFRCGDLDEAIRLVDAWSLCDPHYSNEAKVNAIDAKALLDELGVPASELKESQAAMVEVMGKHKLRQRRMGYQLVSDGYDRALKSVIVLSVSANELFVLNRELDAILAERLDDAHPWAFIAMFERGSVDGH